MDRVRFTAIFKQYYNNIVYYANSYVHDKSVSEEIAQDVFSVVWENIDKLNDNVFPYLITVTKRRCLNYLRKESYRIRHKQYEGEKLNRVQISYFSLSESGIENLLYKEVSDRFYESLNRMPAKTREAFMLNRFYDKTYKEIADIQGVTVKNIEYRIMSALKILRKDMHDFLPVCLGFLFIYL